MYMHRAFAEEIDREGTRDQEYAALSGPADVGEVTGLTAFDEIDPVSTVSALQAQPQPPPRSRTPSPYASVPPSSTPSAVRSAPPGVAPRAHKATLMGIPAAVPLPGR